MSFSGVGSFQIQILLSIHRHEGPMTSKSILQDLEVKLGRDITEPQMSFALKRLTLLNYVETSLTARLPVRGGWSKKAYSLTDTGIAMCHQALYGPPLDPVTERALDKFRAAITYMKTNPLLLACGPNPVVWTIPRFNASPICITLEEMERVMEVIEPSEGLHNALSKMSIARPMG